jgi:hypothetical protein
MGYYRGVFSMNQHCSLCGTNLLPADEEGLCHLCKMSIIFNEETFPDVDDCAS